MLARAAVARVLADENVRALKDHLTGGPPCD